MKDWIASLADWKERSFLLNDSFNYTGSMELVKCCNRTINDVEKKVLALDENGESHEF